MHKPTCRFFILLLIASSYSWASPAEQEEEDTPRGYFLLTRKNPKPAPPRGKPGITHVPPKKNPPITPKRTRPEVVPAGNPRPALPEPGAIGIGVTLYQDKKNEGVVRVSTSETFSDGDKVRFVIETNTDGFLYVFQSENNRPPKMVFPDYRVKQGANKVEAHVPYEAPSRRGAYNWFEFEVKEPATLRLYFVISRQPLGGIPTHQELAKYCKGEDCSWTPSPKEFEPVLAGVAEKKLRDNKDISQRALTVAENERITREIKLVKRELEPDVVYVNPSAKSDILVVATELTQKP